MQRGRRSTISTLNIGFDASTRVLSRPIDLDMAEVGGSTPPGPAKFLNLCFNKNLFFQTHGFWRVFARSHYRAKVKTNLPSAV